MDKLIEQIHADFSFDLFEQVRQSNDFSFLERYRPSGIDQEDFIDQVERYRTFYPSNNFITEKQIAEICSKYDLVLGAFMNFTGEIPVKNRLELKTFHLRPDDQVLFEPSLPGRIYDRIVNHAVIYGEATLSPKFVTLRSGFIPGDPLKPFDLLPVGDFFVLVSAEVENSGIYRLFMKLDFYGSEWLVDLGLVSVGDGTVTMNWQRSIASRPMGAKTFGYVVENFGVELNLPTEFLSNITAVNLSANVCPQVVAPGTMFERYRGAVEKVGYRLRFKPGTNPIDRTSFVHVDDPIILQPVKYGYLVVTKWGREGMIGEVQNTKTN
jgi:hypothetical protein